MVEKPYRNKSLSLLLHVPHYDIDATFLVVPGEVYALSKPIYV